MSTGRVGVRVAGLAVMLSLLAGGPAAALAGAPSAGEGLRLEAAPPIAADATTQEVSPPAPSGRPAYETFASVFNDTFPIAGVPNATNWQIVQNSYINVGNDCGARSSPFALLIAYSVNEVHSRVLDLSSSATAYVTYWWRKGIQSASPCEGPDGTTEDLWVEYLQANGVTWAVIQNVDGTTIGSTVFQKINFSVPAADLWSGFKIRFRQQGGSGSPFDFWAVDDVDIATTPKGFAMTIASSPPGMQVLVNGTPQTTPYNFLCLPGSQRVLNVTSPQAMGGTRYSFADWSDAGPQNRTITCTAPATYTANFIATDHSQTVDTSPAGRDFSVNVSTYSSPQTWWCPIGTNYTVSVPSPQGSPSTRYVFSSWSDGGAQSHLVVCSAPRTVTARLATEHNISMATSPSALDLTVNGSASTAPFAFWCGEGTSRVVGAPSPQGTGDTRQVFMNWSDGGAQTHSVTCGAPMTLQANFTTGYRTTLDATDPGISLTVGGNPSAAPFDYWCPGGTSPTIGAPSPQVINLTRYTFSSWSDAGAQSHAVTCSAPATYTATYTREFRLYVGSSPGGLQVLVDATGYTAPYTAWCPEASVRTVDVASPQTAGGTRYVYANWSDAGAQSHSVTCSAAVTVTANFRTEHNTTIATSPSGLEVLVDGTPRTAPYNFWCDQATGVMVNATSPQGAGRTRYAFASWSDGGAQEHSVPCGSPRTVTANFLVAHEISIEANTPGLNLSVNGTLYPAPYVFWCFANTTRVIDAPSPQGTGDVRPVFRNWSDGGAKSHSITCDVPKNITANYATGFRTTLASAPTGLMLEVNGVPQAAPYDYWCANQTSITVNAPSPQGTGQTRSTFQSWSDSGAQSHSVTCTAPVTLTASYVTEHETTIATSPAGLQIRLDGVSHTSPHTFWCVQGPPRTIDTPSPQDLGAIRYVFGSWSDSGAQNHSITCPSPRTVTATFATSAYSVNLATSPSGLVVHLDGAPQTAPYQFWCGAGSTHSLFAPSPQGTGDTQNVYVSWSNGGTQAHNITCSGAMNVTAAFATAYRTTLDTNPAGLMVEVDGNPQTAPAAFWCQAGTSRKIGAPSPQGTGQSRMAWKSWSDAGGQSHLIPCAAPGTITATFEQEHQITLASDPPGLRLEVNGQGVSLPYSLWCSASTATTVNAPSPQGSGSTQHNWVSWSDGGAKSHSLACAAPGTVTAKFATQFKVTVNTNPGGLLVGAAGQQSAAPAEFWCDAGSSGTVDAPSPQEKGPTRWVFASWSDGGARSHSVKCDSPAAVTATFTAEHKMRIDTYPAGMQVEVASQTQSAPHEFWCPQGSSVALAAPAEQVSPSDGKTYVFDAWSDGRDRVRSIVCSSPTTYIAKYKAKPPAPAPPPEDTLLGMPTWMAATLFIVIAVVLGLLGAVFGQRRRKGVEGPVAPLRQAPPRPRPPPPPAVPPQQMRPGAPPPPPSMRGPHEESPGSGEEEEAQEVASEEVIPPDNQPRDQGWEGWPPEK